MGDNLQNELNACGRHRLSGESAGNPYKGARWTAEEADAVPAPRRHETEVENVRREGIRNAAG